MVEDDPVGARAGTAPVVSAYGLRQVTVAEALTSLRRVLPDRADEIWARVLDTTGLHGTETDLASVHRLVDAMQRAPDPIVAMCGRSLRIRLSSFEHLAATHALVSGV